ncbi:MAG: cytochrome-c oxidase, cbb3-type subunit II [Hyphomicrobiales bacterium]|nr:cytochrome-c oxidase, cbb3-type subunit II [Hyphomicrobiales bacterium]MBV8443725.1 cytochrome-c oxidase, cbb3-type subunit II [Hyphomicrobiales bacterium]
MSSTGQPHHGGSLFSRHHILETSPILLVLGILVMVAIGGLVEIVPLFYLKSTIETVQGMRPYTPLELAGRNIYVREGCYLCHSQMIRSLRDEVERYGHYSLAAESMYDHPFQWGSKRNGPDIARVGGKYTDSWHVAHLIDPRSVVPQSIMPSYGFLMTTALDTRALVDNVATNREVGVPYTDDMMANVMTDLKAQVSPDAPEAAALLKRYPKAVVRKFNPATPEITEGDAVIAYLQMLGTLVDFKLYDDKANLR